MLVDIFRSAQPRIFPRIAGGLGRRVGCGLVTDWCRSALVVNASLAALAECGEHSRFCVLLHEPAIRRNVSVEREVEVFHIHVRGVAIAAQAEPVRLRLQLGLGEIDPRLARLLVAVGGEIKFVAVRFLEALRQFRMPPSAVISVAVSSRRYALFCLIGLPLGLGGQFLDGLSLVCRSSRYPLCVASHVTVEVTDKNSALVAELKGRQPVRDHFVDAIRPDLDGLRETRRREHHGIDRCLVDASHGVTPRRARDVMSPHVSD